MRRVKKQDLKVIEPLRCCGDPQNHRNTIAEGSMEETTIHLILGERCVAGFGYWCIGLVFCLPQSLYFDGASTE